MCPAGPSYVSGEVMFSDLSDTLICKDCVPKNRLGVKYFIS